MVRNRPAMHRSGNRLVQESFMITRPSLQHTIDIDLTDLWQAMDWCNRLQCSYEELRSAIDAVGNSAYLVQVYFSRRTAGAVA
jgi:hypothetical protein